MKYNDVLIQRPFLKWVGGKTQLLDRVLPHFPLHIRGSYHEPFLGGGSVLLALLSLYEANQIRIDGDIHAYDINDSLINTFVMVQKCPNDVFDIIHQHQAAFESLTKNRYEPMIENESGSTRRKLPQVTTQKQAMTCRELYYYYLRHQFNALKSRGALTRKQSVTHAALFIILNKTCFRGVYRESRDGTFNVPYGYSKVDTLPEIATRDELLRISHLLQPVTFHCMSYTESIDCVQNEDVVYIDPPYASEKDQGFTGYSKNNFKKHGAGLHADLFHRIHTLANQTSACILLSNANVPCVLNSFTTDAGFCIEEVTARRAIHSKNPGASAKEVIISRPHTLEECN